MMTRYRRQQQQYVFAGVLAFLAVVNVLFFLILFRPVRSEYYSLQDSIRKLRSEVESREQSAARLEKLNAQLETSAQDRGRLYALHFIPGQAGWSEILRQLDTMLQKTGVKNTRKNYAISPMQQYGLSSVTITMPVSGAYSNIIGLIKEIEESETFFIINSIDVRGSSNPGASEVSLALNLETFFYQ